MPNPARKPSNRPKIGLALSGGSGRAIAHIGVLEVLQEEGFPIDYITACSSAAMIAGSYACGTLPAFKENWFKMDKKFIFSLFELEKSGKGIFRGDKMMDWMREYMGKKFEDVYPRLGFVCSDIISKKPVTLCLGDMMKAGRASCAVPGLFEPVEWGNMLLVDGGLFSLVPTTQAREMGADIVIGVDIAATRYMFQKSLFPFRKAYNFIKLSLPARAYGVAYNFLDRVFTKSMNYIYYNQSDFLEEAATADQLGMFGILGRAMDISIQQNEIHRGILEDCDCLIDPNVKHLGKIDMENSKLMYEEGRRATLAALPEIRKLIQDYEVRKKLKTIKDHQNVI